LSSSMPQLRQYPLRSSPPPHPAFSFSRFSGPADLHSFPTRRSSDLPTAPRQAGLRALLPDLCLSPDVLWRTCVRGHLGALVGTVPSGISRGQRYGGTSVSDSILDCLGGARERTPGLIRPPKRRCLGKRTASR